MSANRAGVQRIITVSDSPVNQFRNKTIFYLMKKYAEKHNIEMEWLFLETGHGKICLLDCYVSLALQLLVKFVRFRKPLEQ